MEKEKKYFKELRKKVDIYFVIILSMLSSLSIYMLYEGKILNQENIYVLMAVLTISFIVYIFSIKENFKSKNINELDKAIFFSNIFLITSLFMFIIIKSIKNRDLLLIYNLTKRLIQRNITISFTVIITSVTIVLTVLSIILMKTRNYFFKSTININKRMSETTEQETLKETKNKIIFTLKDILDLKTNNNLKNIDKIIIKDSDDDIPDIFKIDRTKEELKIAINKYSTIGVVGEWGSGKSTLINSTIKELDKTDFIIIKDFDPWSIKSQDALILAMYNTITENLGENIGFFKRKKIQSALVNISTNIPYIGKGIVNFFENNIDDYTEYKEIKADLEEKLQKSDKCLIFIIDNLDRMSSNNVLFLLTLIETLFKLPNITYILAYYKYRLNDIFEDNQIDLRYLEKIINKEIFMPVLDRHLLEKCLHNLLIVYNYRYRPYDYVIKEICKKFTNIRQFIGFCNSLTKNLQEFEDLENNLGFTKESKLGFPIEAECDYFILQSIKYFDYSLYLDIYNNRNLFVEYLNKDKLQEFISNNYSEHEYLMNLLFHNEKDKRYSILNPILLRICFLDKDNIIENTDKFISSLKTCPEKTALIKFLNISSFSSSYDVIYALSSFSIIINYKTRTSQQQLYLWNLFADCTTNSENCICNELLKIYTIKKELDNYIKYILMCIFEKFAEEKNIDFLITNLLKDYDKNKIEYHKKLIVYENTLRNLFNTNFDIFITRLYKPIFDNPIIPEDQSIFYDFYYYLEKRFSNYDKEDFYLLNYIDKLFSNMVINGESIYQFINFFILEKNIFLNLNHLISDILFTEKDFYDLMKKYPPKDDNEEKIKRDFEERYPKK